ncbi:hypothetical protein TNCV_2671861, partial [Trichonephila clavipes]
VSHNQKWLRLPYDQSNGIMTGVCLESETRTAEDPPSKWKVHLKFVEAQTSSRWCGVQVRRESASSGVLLIT